MSATSLPQRLAIRVITKIPSSFAAEELKHYLARASGRDVAVDTAAAEGLVLGLMADLPGVPAPGVANPELDDAIHIDTRGASGIVAGINPRSVLLAVYRYLTELGCRWVRPGDDGAYVPSLEQLGDVRVSEKPS